MNEFDLSLCESPIQRRFGDAMSALMHRGIKLEPEVWFTGRRGRYRVDLLARWGRRVVVFECDGREFHDSHADALRDIDLMFSCGVTDVFRASGGEINYALHRSLRFVQAVLPELFKPRSRRVSLRQLADMGYVNDTGWMAGLYRTRVRFQALQQLVGHVSTDRSFNRSFKAIARHEREAAILQLCLDHRRCREPETISDVLVSAIPWGGVWV